MPQIFPTGINGLSDSKFAGAQGSAYRLVGVDYRSTPGLTKVHQKLALSSPSDGGNALDEFCKVSLAVSDGSTLHFSSESGKIWREVNDTWTLVHTTVPSSGSAACSGAEEFNGAVYWATENHVHRISVASLGGTWATVAEQNVGEFKNGGNLHPMAVQNLQLFIGDEQDVGRFEVPTYDPVPPETSSVSLGSSVRGFAHSFLVKPSGSFFPTFIKAARDSGGPALAIQTPFEVETGGSRLLVVIATAWRTDNTSPVAPTGATYGAAAMSQAGGSAGNLGSNQRFTQQTYFLVNPPVGSANVQVNWAASEQNLQVSILQFNGAAQSSPITDSLSDSDNVARTSMSTTSTATNVDNHVRVFFARTQTATHTLSDLEVLNGTNAVGRDSVSVHTVGVQEFQPTSDYFLLQPERITALEPFDTDLLIGVSIPNVDHARVLRWDTESDDHSAEDTVYEKGINTFIRDDNFVYVSAGEFGRLYFYNGEILEPFQRIPGDWSPTKRAIIHSNAVAFHMGIPVFGLSNVEGNPTPLGVYGFGKYSRDYPATLSLDYPISADTFEDLEIGAIITQGANLYVTWKTATDAGVDKLDWSNKYEDAYIETAILTPLDARSNLKSMIETWADYHILPENTDVTFSYEKKHDNFTALSHTNDTKLNQLSARTTVTNIAALRLRFDFEVDGNDGPEVEGFGFNLTSKQQR